MTVDCNVATAQLLLQPFPNPGPRVTDAFRQLDLAATGTTAQKAVLGDPARLPRPWDPATCTDPALRGQLWEWLDTVVIWLNHEHTWDAGDLIPTCWPAHPHLTHEIAVLAGQRRTSGLALTSDLLEEWHRYHLPAFLGRMRSQTKTHCDEGHRPWPGRSRAAQHTGDDESSTRESRFTHDIRAVTGDHATTAPQLGFIDLDSGLLVDSVSKP